MERAIDISGLQKSYGDTAVLENFDLSVPAGNILDLLVPMARAKVRLSVFLPGCWILMAARS
ncbi:MAG: hypothetical protein U5J63_08790 [Fodinibius sp.]|nr:hypothetical protein [Fodinibius sp.]